MPIDQPGPGESDHAQIDGLYLGVGFPDPPAGRPYVFINMVASLDGKIAVDGSEKGLSSAADKRLFYELRANADAIVAGAGTARASGSSPRVRPRDLQEWRLAQGRSRHPLGALITASGNLPPEIAILQSDEFDAAIFVLESTPADRVAALTAAGRPVHVLPGEPRTLPAMLALLRSRYGVRRLLCEGGGTLNAGLLHSGAVDELFLTIAPRIVGGRDNPTIVEGLPFPRADMPEMKLLSWRYHPPTGEVFTRWQVQR